MDSIAASLGGPTALSCSSSTKSSQPQRSVVQSSDSSKKLGIGGASAGQQSSTAQPRRIASSWAIRSDALRSSSDANNGSRAGPQRELNSVGEREQVRCSTMANLSLRAIAAAHRISSAMDIGT
eukprot:2083979-Prymnesium_polylepis.1